MYHLKPTLLESNKLTTIEAAFSVLLFNIVLKCNTTMKSHLHWSSKTIQLTTKVNVNMSPAKLWENPVLHARLHLRIINNIQ